MAFVIEQRFEDVRYSYDREGDVLYISFGPPEPCVALGVEDWLAVRITPSVPPQIRGFTIIGFKRIFSRIRPDLMANLPDRVDRLRSARFVIHYSDETDTLTFRFEEEQPAYYERLDGNIYLERALVGGAILGFRISQYTEHGNASAEKVLSSICDALFVTPETPQADALTRALVQHLNLPALLSFAA